MNTNKEVKVAIAVGVIMITACLLIFIFNSAENNVEEINLGVYKLYEIEGKEGEHEYRKCRITTDELIYINKEYKKAFKLNEDDRVIGKQITGNYKLLVGDDYIAFDADDNTYVYRSDTKYLYEFNSDVQEYVKKTCEN